MSVARLTPLMKSRLPPSPGLVTARTISSSARMDKGPIAATKDTLKKVDRTVSDVAIKGIDKGEQAGQKIKEVAGATTQQAKGKAEEAKGAMKGNTQETAGKAKEAKRTNLG